jgi:hypothetical protein
LRRRESPETAGPDLPAHPLDIEARVPLHSCPIQLPDVR